VVELTWAQLPLVQVAVRLSHSHLELSRLLAVRQVAAQTQPSRVIRQKQEQVCGTEKVRTCERQAAAAHRLLHTPTPIAAHTFVQVAQSHQATRSPSPLVLVELQELLAQQVRKA
jgi:hypothetical protein